MRFMTVVKSAENQQVPPALYQAIGELGQQAGKKLLWMGGLMNSATGSRIRVDHGKVRVSDGPFSESKEVIGGFAVYEVESKEEALQWCQRFVDVHIKHWPDCVMEVELRQLFDGPPPPKA
jgi:hypothetical protein